jgi:predicted enzyme related to lactoylglutathione lyase
MTTSLPVVHLELHTGDRQRARTLCEQLCGWNTELIVTVSGSYLALELGSDLGGGIVECGTTRALWLPYVEVREIHAATELARQLGASVLVNAHEGPAGWRSVIATPETGEIGFWQQKGCRL